MSHEKDEALTERQLEILGLVAEGWGNQEIGDILVIDEKTVRTHVSDILKRLGARNRTDAVRIGREMGLFGDGHHVRRALYLHRDGDVDPPTIAGNFWMEIPNPLTRDYVQIAAAPWGEWRFRRFWGDWEPYVPQRLQAMGVRWWGPVPSPWDGE